jgi:polyhydroxyalkanoate synthesis regulator phasin
MKTEERIEKLERELAELKKELKPKVIINGIEMKQDGDVVSFGCAMFEIKQLRELLDAVNCWNSWVIDGDMNRKIKSITLDSDVTITVEQLRQIVDNLK